MVHWEAATRGQNAIGVCMALHIRRQDLHHCLCISEVLSQAAVSPPCLVSPKSLYRAQVDK